jgi:hypothetical protein
MKTDCGRGPYLKEDAGKFVRTEPWSNVFNHQGSGGARVDQVRASVVAEQVSMDMSTEVRRRRTHDLRGRRDQPADPVWKFRKLLIATK